MAKLEDIVVGSYVTGIVSGQVLVLAVKWHGSDVISVTYKTNSGRLGEELFYRDREGDLEVLASETPWSFDGDANRFRLVSEAQRIFTAYLFDPMLAVHTSLVEPLPHQITAVYEAMLPRRPLRFLLADDPGAGKTIMAGLLIKELIARGDLRQCLIVCPGNLVEQWQDELSRKFHLPFEIMTNDKIESARTGNWFQENPLAICRLDKLSRDEDIQAKLQNSDWDLIVCDEAHKMSATFFGRDVRRTKRHLLGQLLSKITRHFLLLTATPHNGKEEDFQLFLSLLDGDRFEGQSRDGYSQDTSDLMRRMLKEDLLRFDGRPLFPERRANTVEYELSEAEATLYAEVTNYVREEFNRADQLQNGGQKGTVGFALTILQRRLASSPEAIYQSLHRRRERLEKRCREEELVRRGLEASLPPGGRFSRLSEDDLDELDDVPEQEAEELEEEVVDQASAARTIAELKSEIAMLARLEELALNVRRSNSDRKWDELSRLLQNQSEMFDAHGHRRKLIIFTEHRDTLNYLKDRISGLIGKPDAVVTIHGGMGRELRTEAQSRFTQDKAVEVLVATDAAGEGINLQRAHLMVNYDLPWNPNRLEQRFGRIHRIGQTEVCHCWNLVAGQTREGDVFRRLLQKLDQERLSLGGKVFDVLGKVSFDGRPLRELLLEAIRYGDDPEVRERLNRVVANGLDHAKLRELIEDHALANDAMDATQVQVIREQMERAEARRLQPHFVASFFREAFQQLGGKLHERESNRYEISRVPATVRNRDRQIGQRDVVLSRYERITFQKDLINVPGKPTAEFVCPGHPLLDAVLDLILEQHRDLLKQGAILIDDHDPADQPRILVYLDHAIHDGRTDRNGDRCIISRQVHFAEICSDRQIRSAGHAPYLDYRPPTAEETALITGRPALLPDRDIIEEVVGNYAITTLVPQHLAEVRHLRERAVDKTLQAVKARLTAEISYWDHRAEQLKQQEAVGKTNAKLNSARARQRADELQRRLAARTEELARERQISAVPPQILAGALIIPAGFLQKVGGRPASPPDRAVDTGPSEQLGMEAVMEAERALGFEPSDVSASNVGYDIESKVPGHGPGCHLRFIEVKARGKGAKTVTVTRNEILTALNKPEQFILAVVQTDPTSNSYEAPCYIRRPFSQEPEFGVTSVNYKLSELLAKGGPPS